MSQARPYRPSARVAACTCAITLAFAALVAPGTASARVLETDLIGGTELRSASITASQAPDVGAITGILVASDGRAVWARGANEERAMASCTKIMTALLALEDGSLDETVTVSPKASNVEYAMGLQSGEKMTVRSLLELALVASSNDAAYALAEHGGGNVTGFVERMNRRALELGLDDTHFANPHGLDASGHHSSAADLAKLARVAMGHEEFRRIVALRYVSLPARGTRGAAKLRSTDDLLGRYPGILGVKTGFTDNAKFSFVASAERDGVTLTAVVLGSASDAERFSDSQKLLDWGFDHVAMEEVGGSGPVGTCRLAGTSDSVVGARFVEATSVPVFDLAGPLTRKLVLKPQVAVPVFEGQPLGELTLQQGDSAIATLPVVASADVASVQETVGAVPVTDYVDRSVPVRASNESVSVEPFNPEREVQRKVSLDDGVKAPVRAGQRVGRITYSQDGKTIAEVPAVAAADVEAPSTVARIGIWLTRTWRAIAGGPTVASVTFAES